MSSLTNIFGQGHNAYFSNGPITRLSFLRLQNAQLDKALKSAKILTFEDLNPLRGPDGRLAFLKYDDVADYIGKPYEKDEKAQLAEFDGSAHHPTLIFLGVDLEKSGESFGGYSGAPYFALDVSGSHYEKLRTGKYTPTRVDLTLPHDESAIYSHARSLLDWNARNRFCSSCGGKTMSTHGGAKVVCPKKGCPTKVGLHNHQFPRTDPTVVIAPISADSKRILLGRGKRWPENYFSCLSGFVEPGESLETATRREAFEETGVKIDRVQLHSSQPWPYPATMLIGAMGQCVEEEITYPETELEEAKWVSAKIFSSSVPCTSAIDLLLPPTPYLLNRTHS